MISLLRSIANIWSLALLLVVAVTLLWFIYAVCVRKIIRARKIAGARLKRLLREAAERSAGQIVSAIGMR
ncbi:MAG: hypothetical protein ACRD2S_00685 [Terriglobales bacterium]